MTVIKVPARAGRFTSALPWSSFPPSPSSPAASDARRRAIPTFQFRQLEQVSADGKPVVDAKFTFHLGKSSALNPG